MSHDFDIIIKNGILVDGTGNARRVADIGVRGDKIVYIGNIINHQGSGVIDAAGYIVAPGFIDIHSHSDFFWLVSPESESKIYDGVTTEICGNCGISAFPLKGQLLENKKKGFSKFGLDINWQTAEDFFTRANEAKSSINRGFLVGHGNVRACVLGYDDREPNSNELVKMEQELRDAMESGAFGMSSGLVYPPGCYAKTDELITLCKIVREYNGIYATHMRNEGDELEAALSETINISKESGVKSQVSHIKTWGEKNWWKIDKIESLLEDARAEGIEITCDRYPYTASATDLDIILPDWVYEGGTAKEKKRLGDPLCRERIIKEMKQEGVSQEFWGTIMISSVFNKDKRSYEGKTIAEISRTLKVPPIEFVLDLLYEEDCRVSVIFFNMSEENLARILKWDFVMVGSDSSLRSLKGVLNYGKPHPRGYGTFSRVIRKYVNQTSILSIEDGIYKMTGFPAQKLGLKDRGILKEGFFADITIFDQETIAEQATFTDPHNYSTGIKYVVVNGKLTINNGKHERVMNGTVLKK
ncbi:MAG: N-acyl-D-amino-acid deacylase family protein [Planctomycetota bacterium]